MEYRTQGTDTKKYQRIANRFTDGRLTTITGDFKRVISASYVRLEDNKIQLIGFTVETVRGIEDFFTSYSESLADMIEDRDLLVTFRDV